MYDPNIEITDELLAQLPTVVGYKVLIAMPTMSGKTTGGVYMPDQLTQREETASIVGMALSFGPEAYKDPNKFPTGPYCKEGDYVIFRSYSGTRFKIEGIEFRLINDDTIEAVVHDPRNYTRA